MDRRYLWVIHEEYIDIYDLSPDIHTFSHHVFFIFGLLTEVAENLSRRIAFIIGAHLLCFHDFPVCDAFSIAQKLHFLTGRTVGENLENHRRAFHILWVPHTYLWITHESSEDIYGLFMNNP